MYESRKSNPVRREETGSKISPLALLSFAALLVFCAGVLGLPFQYAEPDYIAALDRASASGADLLRPRGGHEGTLPTLGIPQATGRPTGTREPGHSRIFGRIGQLRSLVDAKGADPVRPKSVPPKPTNKPVAKSQHKPKSGFDLDLFARAVASHETVGCTAGYGKPPYNNCFGIKNGKTAPCKKMGRSRMCMYDKREDSFVAFKKIWTRWYGGFPTLQDAAIYSDSDGVNWKNVVMMYYNNPHKLKI